jgi:hypothetical protein
VQALELALLEGDAGFHEGAVDGFEHLGRAAFGLGACAHALDDGGDARLVAHLLGRLFDARGLQHVAQALHEQRHELVVERIDGAAHFGHGGAVQHLFDRLAHSKPSSTSSAARSSARALCSVSRHSSSGTLSATTPAAACT